jgi:hypothetical protein
MASQFFATKGLRPKYNYVDAINAQTPYLPQQYQAKQNQEMAEKEFAANEKYMADTLKFQEKGLATRKKDSKLANLIGLGGLGASAYFASEASKKSPGLSAATGSPVEVAKDIAKSPLSEVGKIESPGIIKSAADWLKPNPLDSGSLFSGVTPGNILLGGGTGMVAGSLAGKGKKKKLKSSLAGAGAGAVASYIGSGGDLYKTAVGGLSGGAGGYLSSLF